MNITTSHVIATNQSFDVYSDKSNNAGTLSLRSEVVGVGISMSLLVTLVVGVQTYTKLGIVKKVASEDYCILIGWALYVAGYQPLLYLMSDINSGIAHRSYVPLERFSLIRYYMHVLYILYGLIILAIKSAIIIQCTRILTPLGARTSAYWIFQILLCAHIIVYSTNTFAEIFICSPRAKAWDYTVTNGHCMDIDAVHIASAAVNTASDLLLVIVSQSIIWRMHIPVRRRWAVSSVFLVGLLACVAAIIRMYYTILFARNKNNMRIAIKLSTWVNVEICCGFLVACMPGLPRFFKHPPIASIWIPIVRFLRRSEHSGPTELANAGSKSSDGQAPRSDVLVTDIEFEELVRRTDSDVTLNAN